MSDSAPGIDGVDVRAGARYLVGVLDDIEARGWDPTALASLGHGLDLWMAMCGKTTDIDDPTYEDGMREAVEMAYDLADPGWTPPSPGVVTVTVEGKVL